MNKPQLPFHCLGMERTTRFLCDAQMLNVMADGLPGVVAYYRRRFCLPFCQRDGRSVDRSAPLRLSQQAPRRSRPRSSSPERAPTSNARWPGSTSNSRSPVDFAGGMINVVRGFAYPDKDANGRVLGCFLLLLDITRERAFEAQLQAARDEAVEAIRSKSRFLAAASHDLRQPLHAMTLFVSALSRRLSEGETAELVGNVESSLRSLALDDRHPARHFEDRGGPDQAESRRRLARRTVRRVAPRLRRDGARPAAGIPRRADQRQGGGGPHARRTGAAQSARQRVQIHPERRRAARRPAAARRSGNRRRRHRRWRAARPNRARVRGISSRQDDRDRPQRGHRPRARHRQASGGADGRQGHVALAAGQGQRVHAVAARSGLGAAPGMAPRGAGRNRSRAGAFSSSTTIRFAPPR